MSQPEFFDLEHRYFGLESSGDPLAAIGRAVPFEIVRSQLKAALIKGGRLRLDEDRKSAASRKPWDEVLIFSVLVLQAQYNLSDDQMEYQLHDRLLSVSLTGRILVLQSGRVIAEGTHAHLISAGGWYRDAFLSQQGKTPPATAAG